MNANVSGCGNVVHIRHESDVLRGNPAGDPHIRDLYVYVPAGYAEAADNYPSVYCLTGFTGRGKMLLNDAAFTPNLAQRMDRLVADGLIRPMIAVMPDCFTYYGGSQYINSSATGNYEDYLADEIVSYVDANFRTIANRGSRAVMGISSGGYGSLIMAMRHADTFGLACSISGDAYFETCYLPGIPAAFRAIKPDPAAFMKRIWETGRIGKNDFPGLNIIGMSACYSPNGTSFDLPFNVETGEIRDDVWQRWLAHDPVRLVDQAAENLRSMELLFLDAGSRDEFAMDIGARILAKRLSERNIPHIHEEFDDGHFSISYRYDRSLELISNYAA